VEKDFAADYPRIDYHNPLGCDDNSFHKFSLQNFQKLLSLEVRINPYNFRTHSLLPFNVSAIFYFFEEEF